MVPARTSGTGNAARARSPRSSHVAERIPEAVLQTIAEAFTDLYDREVERSLGGK